MSALNLRDIGLRPTVTPRATDISDRIAALLEALPRLDVDNAMAEKRSRLKEWQFVVLMTIAHGRDMDADEHSAWLELVGG